MIPNETRAAYMTEPHRAEHFMRYRYEAGKRLDFILYPFAINLHMFGILDYPIIDAIKCVGEFYVLRDYWGFDKTRSCFRTLLYRLDLIQQISPKDYGYDNIKTDLFVLTPLGLSALLAIRDGMVWSYQNGVDKKRTTSFYESIRDLASRENPYIITTQQYHTSYGLTYGEAINDVNLRDIEWCVRHDRFKRVEGSKEVIRQLVIKKLERE